MARLEKGTIYEEYICDYINKNNNNIIAYLWKDVPDYILFNANLIEDINDCRINRDTCKNYIHDIGIDAVKNFKIINNIFMPRHKNIIYYFKVFHGVNTYIMNIIFTSISINSTIINILN